jgi:hypothetical protein
MSAHREHRATEAKAAKDGQKTACSPGAPAACDRNQALLGNAAIKAGALRAPPIQTKLRVSGPSDPLEEEADRMAELVVSRKAAGAPGKCPTCGDAGSCPKCRAKSQSIQRKPKSAAPGQLGAASEHQLEALKGRGGPLPSSTRANMENQFGRSFADVRVHTGQSASKLASDFSARAFTSGNDIVFGEGEFQPDSPGGQHLLAHELTHVAQQGSPHEIRRSPDDDQAVSPGNPGPNYYFFRGVMMSGDPIAMRRELHIYVSRHGLRGLEWWYDGLLGRGFTIGLPFSAHTSAYGMRPRTAIDMRNDMVNDAWHDKLAPIAVPTAIGAYAVVHQEALDLLEAFQKTMGATLELLLGESERRIKVEKIRYGIKSQDKGIERGYTAQNTEDFQGLVGAAKDLLSLRAPIEKLQDEKARAEADVMFAGSAAKTPLAAIDAKLAPLQENYKEAKAAASIRYPSLAGVLDESSLALSEAQRLQTVAGGSRDSTMRPDYLMGTVNPTGASAILGHVYDQRLDAIDTVRSKVRKKPDKLWDLDPIVQLTLGVMAGEKTGMLPALVKEHIEMRQLDELFLRSALMVIGFALAIPTGGGSLVATGVAVAGFTLSAVTAINSIRDYQFNMALANTDLDRRAYAIAADEPSLLWVAVDVAFAFLDAKQAVGAFRSLREEARAAMLAAEGAEALKAESKLLESADKLEGAAHSKLAKELRESLGRIRKTPIIARELGNAGKAEIEALARAAHTIEQEAKTAEVIARLGEHELKVTRSGHIVICTDCTWLRAFYAAELAEKPALLARLETAEKNALAGTLDAAGKSDLKMLTADLEQSRMVRMTPGGTTALPKELQDAAALAPKAASKDVKLASGESVPYAESTAKGRGVKGDALTGDHIPSRAALVEAKQNALWAAEAQRLQRALTPAEKDALELTSAEMSQINREGQTLVKGEKFHAESSRTFAGRNRAEQIALDAADLSAAVHADFLKDLKDLEAAGQLTKSKVAEYIQHYQNLVSKGVIAYSDDVNNLLLAYLKKAK